ncbi:N-acetylmuramidase family protein [Marinibactrum halimedae]|uniref:N-acetylmuramidase domain-containing protein n=1 Tax=Marinibactrum halimedae TaxID=1444977 RepID=A0AA37WMJ4_9GAMM|nr:N-acetylmuramidase family protein [Marinibactrum halimedae]MCD9459893.1 N-acetylmuramidase family protein [Marinibactrum halimedae]GLS25251.1 hypothetical protein GCM10007877_09650 [Marinibactrum halimedae]
MEALKIQASVGAGGVNQKEDVKQVQLALNTLSKVIGLEKQLLVDGSVGSNPDNSKTIQAIGQFQQVVLKTARPDGRIDPGKNTHKAIHSALEKQEKNILPWIFVPRIVPKQGLSDKDFIAAAHTLSCEVAAVKAVSDVESSGKGFFDNGAPVLLFEAHHFSKFTEGRYNESHPSISSKQWDRSLYFGGEREYLRLQEAVQLDRSAALKSASYGRYQLMGFNHHLAGYDDVDALVTDMFLDERHHLMAFVRFIQSNTAMHQAIKSKDWASFARAYNGPSYAQNQYDERLSNAYQQLV